MVANIRILGQFDSTKENGAKTGIEQTSAVGIFPDGASPYGIVDMSGNVWEWTLTKYENSINTNNSRVLRGGSWLSSATGLRSVGTEQGCAFQRGRRRRLPLRPLFLVLLMYCLLLF